MSAIEEKTYSLNPGELTELDKQVANLLGFYVHTVIRDVEGSKIKTDYLSKDKKPSPVGYYPEGGLPPYSSYIGATNKVLVDLSYKNIMWKIGSNHDGSYFATLSVPAGPGVLKNYHRVADRVEAALCLAYVAFNENEVESGV